MASATDPAAPDAPDDLTRLKTLLFRDEQSRLSVIEGGVSRLDHRVGSPDRLVETTSEIIVEALQRAEIERHRELSDAIAPVVVASIRNEIRNSRDEMVDALYPITGRMVMAAVSNALRDLADSLNQRIDALTSAERWKLQIRAWVTGRPASELALASARQGAPVRLLFMERNTGHVIAGWSATGEDHRSELVGGLIAAIMNFGRDVLGDTAGDLQSLEFGGREVYLRASAQTIVAAECNSALTVEQREALDSGFLTLLEGYQQRGVVSEPALATFAAALSATDAPARKGAGPGIKIVAALLLLLVLWGVWIEGTRRWKERTVNSVLQKTLISTPALAAYPLSLDYDHGAAKVTLRGLSPANEDFPKLLDRLKTASAPYGFVANTIPVIAASQAAMIRQQIATLDKRLAADSQHYAAVSKSITSMKTEIAGHAAQTASALGNLRTELAALAKRSVNEQKAAMTQIATLEKTAAGLASNTKQLGKSVSALAGQTKALDKARGDLAKRIDTLADIQSRINSPHLRLARLLRSTAIFFSNELDIGDGAKAGKSIAAIASAMQEAGSSIRVIGHADATGTDSKNRKLALQRAQMIAGMLVRAGAPKDRLIVIERGTSYPIAANDGPRVTRNRRVTFEPVYEGETK